MPIWKADPLGPIKRNYERGNLIIRFNIVFPESLTEAQRNELTAILDEAMEGEDEQF